MNDNLIFERGRKIGKRIRGERKKLGINQEELGERIMKLINGEVCVAQNTISGWETGKQIPPINQILALSKIFGCDCGYILCDYDERTKDSSEICTATGLSEESVNYLCFLKSWGMGEDMTKMLDFLLLDAKERDESHHYRSVLDLLRFFLEYDGSKATPKQIFLNGYVVDYECNGSIAPSAIALTPRIVENAALMEMEQALINLKRLYKRKKVREGNG